MSTVPPLVVVSGSTFAVLQRRHFADPRERVAHEADDGAVAQPLQAAAVFCTRGRFLGLLPADAGDLAAAA